MNGKHHSQLTVSQPAEKNKIEVQPTHENKVLIFTLEKGECFVLNQLLPQPDEKRNYTVIVRF